MAKKKPIYGEYKLEFEIKDMRGNRKVYSGVDELGKALRDINGKFGGLL